MLLVGCSWCSLVFLYWELVVKFGGVPPSLFVARRGVGLMGLGRFFSIFNTCFNRRFFRVLMASCIVSGGWWFFAQLQL